MKRYVRRLKERTPEIVAHILARPGEEAQVDFDPGAPTLKPVKGRAKILGDNATTPAILDRFMVGIHIIKITGKSYRVKTLNKNLDKTEPND